MTMSSRHVGRGRSPRRRAAAVVLIAAMALGGCAAGDVELSGGVFDLLGVSSASLHAAKHEPKLASRPGLVVPPSVERLPEPGSGVEPTVVADPSWPRDPDQGRVDRATVEAGTIAAYCKDRDWFETSRPEEFKRVTRDGSLCSPFGSMFNKAIEQPKPAAAPAAAPAR